MFLLLVVSPTSIMSSTVSVESWSCHLPSPKTFVESLLATYWPEFLSMAFKASHNLDLPYFSCPVSNQVLPNGMSSTGITPTHYYHQHTQHFASKSMFIATFSNVSSKSLLLSFSCSTLIIYYPWSSLYNAVHHSYKYTGQSLLLDNEKTECKEYYDLLCLAHNRYLRKDY